MSRSREIIEEMVKDLFENFGYTNGEKGGASPMVKTIYMQSKMSRTF